MSALLGIDVGTSSLKSSIYDVEGTLLGSAIESYPTLHLQPTWGEHDPNRWWNALKDTFPQALKQSHVSPDDIAGIGIDCVSPSFVPVDSKSNALRNAFIPLDVRSKSEVAEIKDRISAERLFEISGNRLATGISSLPNILWVRKNEPSVFEKTWRFVHANSFLSFRLTGVCKMDWSNAAMTLLFETRKRRWSAEVLETFNISPDKLPELCAPTDIIGETCGEGAREVGLKNGIPVAAGSIDTNCAALGAGVINGNQAIDSGGAASCLGVVTDEPHFDNRFLNRCHAVPDKFIIVTQGPHSGVALRWFRDEYCQAEVEEASRRGVNAYDVLDGLAAKSPVGSNGVIFLPYFMGECSPIWDRNATSVFYGITPRCSKSDLVRAIMEGTAFNIKENLDILHDVGVDVKEVIAVGGQSRSLAWLRIRSDIYGKKITTPKAKDTAPLGSAILGGVAAGIYANPAKAAEEICKIDETVQPNQETYEEYQEYYKLYKQVYEDLKPSFKTRASIVH